MLLAARTTEPDEPMTVVMPTGTGKTETMLAVFAADPKRTLVMVPSDALRQQIAAKFQTRSECYPQPESSMATSLLP